MHFRFPSSFRRAATFALALVAFGGTWIRPAAATVTVFPKPAEEPGSPDFTVSVRGAAGGPWQAVPVYLGEKFTPGSTQTQWGRPVSPLSFASVDTNEPIEVAVRLTPALAAAGVNTSTITVRPLALNIQTKVLDGAFHFKVKSWPCQLSIEPAGGLAHPLHLFINPPEKAAPSPSDPNVVYFGPGYHEVDDLHVKDGETVYLAGGAVLELKPKAVSELGSPSDHFYGLPLYAVPPILNVSNTKGVTIRGRGILCCRKALECGQRGDFLEASWCHNLTIEGVTFLDSGHSGPHIVNSDGVHIDNIKVLSSYVNSDGIIMGGTSDALVENCFVHNADDGIEVKIWIPQHDVEFRHCTIWSDLGGSYGLMSECNAASRNIAFHDCTVIHSTDNSSVCPVIGINLQGSGSATDYSFKNMVVEQVSGPRRPAIKVFNNWDGWQIGDHLDPANHYEPVGFTPHDPVRGAVQSVTFQNISVLQAANPDVVVMGDGPHATISDVHFANVRINGRQLTPHDPRLKTNEWASGVIVTARAKTGGSAVR